MRLELTLDVDLVDAPFRWSNALAVARLFAVDPIGLCGVVVRAAPGPVRESWVDYLRGALAPGAAVRRLPPGVTDDRLLGGIDLVATLSSGRPVVQNGVLVEADGGIVIVPMAERLTAGVSARIAGVLDRGDVSIEREGIGRRVPTHVGIVALDEGATQDEQLPRVLADRLAFHIDLDGISARELGSAKTDAAEMQAARVRLAAVAPASDEIMGALARAAISFGIGSVVAPLLALRAARATAALAGRTKITADDAVLAAQLVLAPRAIFNPDAKSSEVAPCAPQPAEQPQPNSRPDESEQNIAADLEDVICEALRSALPAGLLQTAKGAAAQRAPQDTRTGVGREQVSLVRGRPAGVRMGEMRPGARLALVETLRAAAPWQSVRHPNRTAKSGSKRIDVRREDFRFKKFVRQRASTVVFCVDASGSTAFHRLAEAKGAVELLLAEAYVARTYVALIAFRGQTAELLLPPSRSLTRARVLLSTLPGGGGTPMAAGIDAAVLVALVERSKGREPLIVLLTDGCANIARDGQAVRPRATDEALASATQVGAQHLAAVLVDTSARARAEGPALASAMRARYVALPRVEASAVRDVVRASMP
jgi:magnesium chelatase subunit D